MREIISFQDATDKQLVGGKAHALNVLLGAGFTVPPGFVVSSSAFMNMTPSVKEAILSSFDSLSTDLVAVRSSAIGEDSADAAWAGQLDTFLNCTRDNLIEHIEKCWQSAGSERAQSYAKQKSLEGTKVAVIVQAMIQSDISGVAFSVHPVTQSPDHIVIEAGLGLGEAIVSGEVTPDTFVVNKQTGEPTEKHIGHQAKKLARSADGTTDWLPLSDEGKQQKLTDTQITELSILVKKLEALFTYPVDVEWGISDNIIYILQSRPITTLAS